MGGLGVCAVCGWGAVGAFCFSAAFFFFFLFIYIYIYLAGDA